MSLQSKGGGEAASGHRSEGQEAPGPSGLAERPCALGPEGGGRGRSECLYGKTRNTHRTGRRKVC